MHGENEPRQPSWFVFHDVLHGPPTPWVPPCDYPSPIPPSSEYDLPTSLWKGRGGCACVLASEGTNEFLIEPTSLNRGEGLAFGWLRVVRVELEGRGRGGGGGRMRE